MAISQSRSKRKITGSVYKDFRKKKQFELGRDPSYSRIGSRKIQILRTMGGNTKQRTLSDNIANLYDPKTKTHKKAKIRNIVQNPANRNFIRRNIMTKGAIIETEFGRAKITSRPGQHGVINAILV